MLADPATGSILSNCSASASALYGTARPRRASKLPALMPTGPVSIGRTQATHLSFWANPERAQEVSKALSVPPHIGPHLDHDRLDESQFDDVPAGRMEARQRSPGHPGWPRMLPRRWGEPRRQGTAGR